MHLGRTLMLLRRSRRLFEHIARVLDMVPLESQIAVDYNTILRLHLLPVPEYYAEAAATTAEGRLPCLQYDLIGGV